MLFPCLGSSLVALLVGSSIGVLGCAQGLERGASAVSPLETGRSTDSTLRVVEPERPGFDSRPWADDSLRVLRDREHAALETAEVDPGILMYTEPPPGTSMPVYTPPDSVDPDMIWPPNP